MSKDPLRDQSPQAILESYGYSSLQYMAKWRGLATERSNKSRLVQVMSKQLFDPTSIDAALRELGPRERQVLDRILLMGGSCLTTILRRQLEAEGVTVAAKSTRGQLTDYRTTLAWAKNRDSQKFEDIVARLGMVGLVFTANQTARDNKVDLTQPGRVLYIPTPVARRLPPVELPVPSVAEPATVYPAAADALLHDVYELASLARRESIPLTKNGQLPKKALTRLNDAFSLQEDVAAARTEEDLGRMSLLRALGEDTELLAAGVGRLHGTDELDRFLALPRGERLHRLFGAYRTTIRWSELARLPHILFNPRGSIYHVQVAQARQRVIAELAELPVETWIGVKHVVDRIRIRAYEFLFPRTHDRSFYYYSYSPFAEDYTAYYGANPLGLSVRSETESASWETVEARVVHAIVAQALYWLGVVDLGYESGSADPAALRITAAGKALLSGKAPALPAPEARVVVQPNFQLFVFLPADERLLFMLDRMATRLRTDQAIEYRLTRESVYAAQQDGLGVREVLAFLEQVSSTPIPQNIRRSLEEWGAQHERILVHRSTPLIQTIDAATLDALYADSTVGGLLGRRLTPTLALVPLAKRGEVFTYLLTGGPDHGLPIPAVTEGDDTQPTSLAGRREPLPGDLITNGQPVELDIDRSGIVTPRQKLPSIYVLRAIRAFADDGPDGSLQLTPASLRRGARQQLTPDVMIATLERLHGGALAVEVQELIRRWAKDWGRGALARVTILQVETADILKDLLADRQLKPLLQPIPDAPALAAVREGDEDRLHALLAERGMDLTDRLF